MRRSQVILMSAEKKLKAQAIADRVGYSDETVRQVIQRFNQEGFEAIYPKSNAHTDDQGAFKDEAREQLKARVNQSPRDFGCESRMWTLHLMAEISYQEGLTDHWVHSDTVGETLHQLGLNWKKPNDTFKALMSRISTKSNEIS